MLSAMSASVMQALRPQCSKRAADPGLCKRRAKRERPGIAIVAPRLRLLSEVAAAQADVVDQFGRRKPNPLALNRRGRLARLVCKMPQATSGRGCPQQGD